MEQLLCARGYSDQVAGFASSSYLFSGCIAALPVSIVASKIKKSLQISKMLLVVGILAAGALAYLVTVPNQPAMLITFCLITGIFTIRYFFQTVDFLKLKSGIYMYVYVHNEFISISVFFQPYLN